MVFVQAFVSKSFLELDIFLAYQSTNYLVYMRSVANYLIFSKTKTKCNHDERDSKNHDNFIKAFFLFLCIYLIKGCLRLI